jgi:hypothetical protein
MISPLLPGLSGTQTGAAELAGSPLTPAQAIKLGREQGRLLLEASSTPARMPALQSGETLLAQVSERLPDGKLAAQIKGEPFILTVPQDGKVEGEALRLRVATTQPLSFFLLDGDDLKPPPSPADQIAARQSQALANAMQLAASSEGVALETLSQPTGKMPAFQTGEWVMAKVAERLPDGSAAVLVKNAAFTLKAPGDGQALRADPLLLRVRSTEPVLSFQQVDMPQAAETDKSAAVTFSTASRYLSSLLTVAGGNHAANQSPGASLLTQLPPGMAGQLATGSSPLATTINSQLAASLAATPPALHTTAAHAALLADPAQPAQESETRLKATVEKSGVFYEAHQKAWANGRLSLDELKQEPQARLASALPPEPTGKSAVTQEIGHLVQRQLDTLEQKQFVFTGQAWPGQLVQWQIQPEEPGEREANGQQDMRAWHTNLALSLPALGGLAARIRMVGNQIQLTFDTDNPEAAAMIEQHRQQLAGSMEAAGLALASLQVRHETGSP